MNRFIPSAEGTILFRMSNSAEYYNENKGAFEVRYNAIHIRQFSTLLEAFLFYYTVEEEAQLWDNTVCPFLIESKIKLHMN
jgi:hypothetical protein